MRETLAQIRSRPPAAVAAAAAAPNLFAAAPAAAPAAPAPVSKRLALESLAAEVAACTACKLHPTRTHTVFGCGNPDARVLFIGEAPGRNEDEQGLPFVGRAGQLLTDILRAIRFERDEVYICNILKCRPPENRDPEPDEAGACEPFLRRQLAIIQPHLICCLGRHAAMTLLDTRASLRSLRESVHFYQGIPVLATFHPAALLRNPHWKRDTWEDVRKLRALHDALLADAS
ncbi:MAG: uracil-DNA glycosylase [bacterium]|nr:uracil-DNA glycosylase [bacterium]